jgi:hypothetical protein
MKHIKHLNNSIHIFILTLIVICTTLNSQLGKVNSVLDSRTTLGEITRIQTLKFTAVPFFHNGNL